MQPIEKVIDCYDKSAAHYAAQFKDELSNKPLDRLLLQAFAKLQRMPAIDLGCGPGQTTRLLKDNGLIDVKGIDISPKTIEQARLLHPDIQFEQGNILQLAYPDQYFQSAIAFYAIVHFQADQLKLAFEEIYRVLAPDSPFLFSFHIGTETIHQHQFLEQDVDIDFYFFEVDPVVKLAKTTGFYTQDIIERAPYPNVEYPSKRAYIWLKK